MTDKLIPVTYNCHELPLTYPVIDFMRECMEDIWNTGFDDVDRGPVTVRRHVREVRLRLGLLPRWAIGWTVVAGEPCWMKESNLDRLRVQCIVRVTAIADEYVYDNKGQFVGAVPVLQPSELRTTLPPHVEFRVQKM